MSPVLPAAKPALIEGGVAYPPTDLVNAGVNCIKAYPKPVVAAS